MSKSWSDLVGKTIAGIDETFGDNVIVLHFIDTTSAVIDTEAIGFGLYSPVLFELNSYDEVYSKIKTEQIIEEYIK